jgi:hypothetical protein
MKGIGVQHIGVATIGVGIATKSATRHRSDGSITP